MPLMKRLPLFLALLGALPVFAACDSSEDQPLPGSAPTNVLYVQSNDTRAGQNAILAYRRGADGALTMLGSYPTGGAGHSNPTAAKLGPNDLDDPIIASPDHRRMFAVNGGSNTIAVFDIQDDGSLEPVAGSPFRSGGRNPVSLGLAGNRLYVVNKNEDAAQLPNADLPNYTGFTVADDGRLTAIPGSAVTTIAGASPSHALVSRDGRLLFVEDFLAPAVQPGIGSIRSFRIGGDGRLAEAPGSPYAVPDAPPGVPPAAAALHLPLGTWTHPTENILYVGHVTYNQLGVYDFDRATGALSFVRQMPNSGKEICWVRTTADGRRLYTVNNIDNSVSFYDNADPRNPVERQKLVMSEPGPLFLNDRMDLSFEQITSTPFQMNLSPDERYLYVVNQRVDFNSSYQEGNNIHVLRIADDGTLSEQGSPVDLPVPPQMRPQGIVVF